MNVRIYSLILSMALLASCRQGEVKNSAPLLYLSDDLEATLWAESPMFYNPTNMDIDSRGGSGLPRQ